MDSAQAIEIAAEAVRLAGAAGASESEATVSTARNFHVEARDESLAKLEQSTAKSMHLRVFVGGRRATLVTSDFTPDALRSAVERVVAQAQFVADDALARLPESFATEIPDLDLYDEAVASRDDRSKVDDAFAMERLVREADARVDNSSGSHYSDSVGIVALVNSAGFRGAYASSRSSRATAPVASDGPHKRTAHYGTSARRFAEMESVEAVAAQAARRAVESFGARKPPTMTGAVIFDRDIAAALVEEIFAAVAASNVAVGNSWLAERMGERLGNELLDIVDDALMPGKLGSSPFDGEGVATGRTHVIEGGVLRSFLYDTYYARKLGARSTGNSTGGGVGTNNFYLRNGTQSVEALIASTKSGVFITDTIGFGHEHATGSYSRGARGFAIVNGELAYPIDEFTIAGNMISMLAALDGVADDLRFDAPVVSPTLRIGEMTISGS